VTQDAASPHEDDPREKTIIHGSFGHLTPNEFAMQGQAEKIAEEVVCFS
jgi:isopentenyl phosphate kinase